MGEAEFEQKPLAKAVGEALLERASEVHRVMTPGGKFQVRCDEGGCATALGQLAFFAEFLEVSGLFERWVDGCPSPNAPEVRDVLGTLSYLAALDSGWAEALCAYRQPAWRRSGTGDAEHAQDRQRRKFAAGISASGTERGQAL